MKTLIVANWKMNPETSKEAKKLFDGVKKKAKSKNTQVIICPPFVYLPLLKGLALGAQDVFFEEKGAFTGEISPTMLEDIKVEYVIVGHSERRKYFAETDEVANKKLKKVFSQNLTPIFCVGEKEGEDKSQVLVQQLTKGLEGISRDNIRKMIIAYEPVWAIGTGNNCSVDQTLSSLLLIRKILADMYNREIADEVALLYGGSVNSKNSAGYIKEAGANGLLVGGASLNSEEFTAIVKSVL